MEVRHLSFVGQLVRIDLLSTMTRGLTFVGRCDNALAEPHRWWEDPNYEGQIPQKTVAVTRVESTDGRPTLSTVTMRFTPFLTVSLIRSAEIKDPFFLELAVRAVAR
jgi:hypothetical protein